MHRIAFPVLSLLAVLPILGCGPATPAGNRVHGKITYKGAPVPAGTIYFDPDPTKGGSGGQGYSMIHDGAFDTSLEGQGQGSPSGAVIVRIDGYEKGTSPESQGTQLFHFEAQESIDGGDAEKSFEVPESAAVKGVPAGYVEP